MQGLTDRLVARSAPHRTGERMMAHDRLLDWSDAVARGVDLVTVDAGPLLSLTSDAMLSHVREAVAAGDSTWAADVGDGEYLVGLLPRGPAVAARRMPRLRFERLAGDGFLAEFFTRSIAAWSDTLARNPVDRHARLRLAWLKLAHEEYEAALENYRVVVAAAPDDLEAWDGLAWCEVRLGRSTEARAALERAIELARAQGEAGHLADLTARLAALPERGR